MKDVTKIRAFRFQNILPTRVRVRCCLVALVSNLCRSLSNIRNVQHIPERYGRGGIDPRNVVFFAVVDEVRHAVPAGTPQTSTVWRRIHPVSKRAGSGGRSYTQKKNDAMYNCTKCYFYGKRVSCLVSSCLACLLYIGRGARVLGAATTGPVSTDGADCRM